MKHAQRVNYEQSQKHMEQYFILTRHCLSYKTGTKRID